MPMNKKKDVPLWAAVLGSKNYPLFIKEVDCFFKVLGKPYIIDDDMVAIDWDGKGRMGEFGLENLARKCSEKNPKDYITVMVNHFGPLLDGATRMAQMQEDMDDFEKAKQYLCVRLYSRSYVKDEGLVCRKFAGELYETLVFDFPAVAQPILKQDAEKWNKSLAELFKIGLKNTHHKYSPIIKDIPVVDDFFYAVTVKRNLSAPNILLELKEYPELIGTSGSIIAAPTKNLLMIYPVVDGKKTVDMTYAFVESLTTLYGDGQDALTKELYWYYDGRFEVIKYRLTEKDIGVMLPEKLAILLGNELV